MKEFYLSKEEELVLFIEQVLPRIPANELITMEFASGLSEPMRLKAVLALKQHCKKGFLKVPVGDLLTKSAWANQVIRAQINLVAQEELIPNPAFSVDPAVIRDHPFEHRSLPASRWKLVRELAQVPMLIPELKFNEEHMDLLYPSLGGLAKAGVSLILLQPGNLNLEKFGKVVREQLRLLQITGVKELQIQFSPSHPQSQEWNARTENLYSGPLRVDIDVANTCTHNCVFCGLYAPDMMELYKKRGGGQLPAVIREEAAARIDKDRCLKMIDGLTERVELVQFGGKGDPFTHPNIMEFIEAARLRNIPVEMLTNFAYMTPAILDRLHELSATTDEHKLGLRFIVNLSAASPESYARIRPNQKPETFTRVINDISYLAAKRKTFGAELIIMSVTNRLNSHEIPELIALTNRIGARVAWIKPVEIHGEATLELLVDEMDSPEYAINLQMALILADFLGVFLLDRYVIEAILQRHPNITERMGLDALAKRIHSSPEIALAMQKLGLTAEHLKKDLSLLKTFVQLETKKSKQLPTFNQPWSPAPLAPPTLVVNSALPSLGESYGVANGDVPAEFLDRLPCKIGNQYLRIEVRGRVLPCCIANYPVADISASFSDIWFSHSLGAFRQKMNEAPKERFHRNDKEWAFCQQCCHMDLNRKYNEWQGSVAP